MSNFNPSKDSPDTAAQMAAVMLTKGTPLQQAEALAYIAGKEPPVLVYASGTLRERLEAALAKPIPDEIFDFGSPDFFDPWEDVIQNIHGNYSGECSNLMIEVMEAVRDRKTFDLVEQKGFAAEFMLYVLSGHGLTEYGTSPRGAWPMYPDLWQPLIDKWKAWQHASENRDG